MTASAVWTIFVCMLTACYSLSPIIINGAYMYDAITHDRFLVRGSGYDYSASNDHRDDWSRALANIIAAAPAINTIRLYDVNPLFAYDQFMRETAANGIYVIVPLTPSHGACVLNRDGHPALDQQSCYPSCLLQYGQRIVNMFAAYNHTLAFAVGNEIINTYDRWNAAPCIKAYTRDIKAHMKQCHLTQNNRVVPLVYAAADNAISGYSAQVNVRMKADYLTCGDASTAIDLFGINLFRWCNDQCTYDTCESDVVLAAMRSMTVPTILSEYGCSDFYYLDGENRTRGQRDWQEVDVLYNQMNNVFSGGCAYTYGNRGGEPFAFFSGGSRSAIGTPGFDKACGFPNKTCNVDLYGRHLTNAKAVTEAAAANWMNTDIDIVIADVICPQINGIDLSVPETRYLAPGYEYVGCETHDRRNGSRSSQTTNVSQQHQNSNDKNDANGSDDDEDDDDDGHDDGDDHNAVDDKIVPNPPSKTPNTISALSCPIDLFVVHFVLLIFHCMLTL